MEKHYFEIRDGKRKTFSYREEIRNMGFSFTRDGCKWVKTTDGDCNKEIVKLKKFCRKRKLSLVEYTDGCMRSATYREKFFRHNPPFVRSFYVCAYCMRPQWKKDITVDHIIPVKGAQANAGAKRAMKRMGITNINDVRNLAPACKRCNSKKGTKCGSWIWRGMLGRQNWFICLCWGLAFSVLIILIILIIVGNWILLFT